MNTVEEFVKFYESTITTQGEMLGSLMKLNVVATSKNSWYLFNEDNKLWESQQDEEFYSYLSSYLNSLITKINELLEIKDCECETNKQLLKQFAKKSGIRSVKIDIQDDKSKCTCNFSKLKELAKILDKKNYIKDIRERFFKSMLDKDFEKKLNSNPDILSLQGGKKINLRTLEVSEKTANDYCTFACNVSYVTETPNADRFFNEIMPNKEHQEFLRKVLGWMLTGDTKARKFQTWYGNGSNGKSVVLGLLKKILNDYYVTADKAVFVKSTFQSKGSEASPHLYSLLGKRVIAYSEGETSDNFELDLSVLKNISGEDPIRCRGLFKDQIEFLSQGKLVLATNYVPPLTTEDAIKDRTLVIFFDQRFTDKPQKNEKLKDVAFIEALQNEYLSEVFSWIVKGSKIYYQENRKIDMPEEFKKRAEVLISREDSIHSFFTNCCSFTGNRKDCIKPLELFESYKEYSTLNSQRCQPRSTLYNRLQSIKEVEKSVLHGYDIYRGIKIIDHNKEVTVKHDDPLEYGVQKDHNEAQEIIKSLRSEIEELKKLLASKSDGEDKIIVKPTLRSKSKTTLIRSGSNIENSVINDESVDKFIEQIEFDDELKQMLKKKK